MRKKSVGLKTNHVPPSKHRNYKPINHFNKKGDKLPLSNIPRNIVDSVQVIHGNIRKDPFVVLRKPSGLVVEDSDRPTLRAIVAGLAEKKYSEVYFPHRLDKDTEGIIIAAFDEQLNSTFIKDHHNWDKQYRALTDIPSCLSQQNTTSISQSPFLQGDSLLDPMLTFSQVVKDNAERGKQNDTRPLRTHGHLKSNIARRSITSRTQFFFKDYLKNQSNKLNHILEGQRHFYKEHALYCGRNNDICHCHLTEPRRFSGRTPPHPFIPDDVLFENIPAYIGHKHQTDSPSRNEKEQQRHLMKKGKPAHSEYWLDQVSWDKQTALYHVKIHTGRTHQIRIHFADAGFPLVGDPYYNMRFCTQFMFQVPGFKEHFKQSQEMFFTSLIESIQNNHHNSLEISNQEDNNNQRSKSGIPSSALDALRSQGLEYPITIPNELYWNFMVNYGSGWRSRLKNNDFVDLRQLNDNFSKNNIDNNNNNNNNITNLGEISNQTMFSKQDDDDIVLGLQAFYLSFKDPTQNGKRLEFMLDMPKSWKYFI